MGVILIRKQGETYKQLLVRCNEEIEDHKMMVNYYKEMLIDFQNGNKLVCENEVILRDERIERLVNKLQQFGLWEGE